jgi:hypothetical protein
MAAPVAAGKSHWWEGRKPTPSRKPGSPAVAAVAMLLDCLEAYQGWRDGLPASLTDSAIADRLDEVLALRDLGEQLEAAELPKGFGRD